LHDSFGTPGREALPHLLNKGVGRRRRRGELRGWSPGHSIVDGQERAGTGDSIAAKHEPINFVVVHAWQEPSNAVAVDGERRGKENER
jgi:hypothetical protein